MKDKEKITHSFYIKGEKKERGIHSTHVWDSYNAMRLKDLIMAQQNGMGRWFLQTFCMA